MFCRPMRSWAVGCIPATSFPVTVFSAVMLSGLRCNAFWRHDSKFVLVAFGPVLAKSVANQEAETTVATADSE